MIVQMKDIGKIIQVLWNACSLMLRGTWCASKAQVKMLRPPSSKQHATMLSNLFGVTSKYWTANGPGLHDTSPRVRSRIQYLEVIAKSLVWGQKLLPSNQALRCDLQISNGQLGLACMTPLQGYGREFNIWRS